MLITPFIISQIYYLILAKKPEKDLKMTKCVSPNAIGFYAFTKPLKKIKIRDGETGYIYKANFDVEIATDILLDKSKVDEIIIFSGDSDFEYLVKRLKDTGKKVSIFSSRKTISWELKLAASSIGYLEDIEGKIKRE